MSVFIPYHLTIVAGFIAQRVRTEEKPPILAVVPTQSRFGLSWCFRSHDALPCRRQTVQILRVDGSRPAPTARLFRRKADEVQIVLVEELGASIGPRRPGQRRNRVDDQFEIAFARASGLFGAFALVNIESRLYQRTMCPFVSRSGNPRNWNQR